ncbi:PPOX class F420-dependent oxidoreductase [Nonomuraea deserti]|uniref:PPOX class F420-dependent oxidoreductase n=1 Tax=Nonomuraea deserti TaxID=1848322 RepID=A0A4R4U7M5_9ACTN|nr:PPOX class F420-dependent oxidoreductase [Nonomuraea deserti]TDC84724.1 PPOX class F420-dependent oxidoreductase [Nonomuraea deserti]
MTRQQAIEFLAAGTRTGKLATASPDGAPHVAPIWFVVDGDDLVFTTGRDTLKGRHLRANPRAALAVDLQEYPYAFVTARGPVRFEEAPDDLLAWTTRLAERYVPPGRAADYGRRNLGPAELLCRLRAERLIGQTDIAV